ncbi:hypothetical protein TSH7_00755 [Azospirillum sp. TSH7]|nr:hypothetical protein TSH20_17875 [Azospirillum sp. TSH20]PWC69368.1 hypothetical protein TSH7_00755 [Azospirillum sp. TSH7]
MLSPGRSHDLLLLTSCRAWGGIYDPVDSCACFFGYGVPFGVILARSLPGWTRRAAIPVAEPDLGPGLGPVAG